MAGHPEPRVDGRRLTPAPLAERAPERLLAVGEENEMNVVGCQAIGKRPPRRARGIGSPGDRDKARSRPRRRTRARAGRRAHVT